MQRHIFCKVAILVFLLGSQAFAADGPIPKGLWLVTNFPSMTAQAGGIATLQLKLQNSGLPPERTALSVQGAPTGWKAQLLGGGQPVDAAMPFTNDSVGLELRVDIPANQAAGVYTLTVLAKASGQSATLPIQVNLGQEVPAKFELKPKLPSLRGSNKALFEYNFTITNTSGKNLVITLSSQTPPNFQGAFTENYGSQEINSIPVDAGQSKDLKFRPQLPNNTPAGSYDLTVEASSEGTTVEMPLGMQVVGRSNLQLTGKDDRLSAEAVAGKTSQIPLVVSNTGSAPVEHLEFSASLPPDWRADFGNKTIERLDPGQKVDVVVNVTPSAKAIAGDYMNTLYVSGKNDNTSAQIRMSVTTSTLWGIVGVGIITAALLVLGGAVARFGRR